MYSILRCNCALGYVMMLWREVVGILQPMGVVELGSTVIVQQGSSSVTVVKAGQLEMPMTRDQRSLLFE